MRKKDFTHGLSNDCWLSDKMRWIRRGGWTQFKFKKAFGSSLQIQVRNIKFAILLSVTLEILLLDIVY